MTQKVLIIEDNNDIRDNIVEILGLTGYTVFEAATGKTGVQLAMQHLPDIILCDIMMPDLDGYGVVYMLGKQPETATIPFIFITAKAERADVRKGMEMGADDYLIKPFDDMELLNAIEARLKKNEAKKHVLSHTLDELHHLVSKTNGLEELRKTIVERKTRLLKKNQVIYYEGDKASGLYLIINGSVKTIKLSEDGRELMTGIYTADDFLGINAVMADDCYSDTATTTDDSQVCLIPKERMDELLNLYPEVGLSFIKLLAKDNREKEDQLLQLAYHSVRKKMADTLLRLYKNQAVKNGMLKVSRENLAAMSGMATETVSRTLSDFKEEGLVDKKSGYIIIIHPDKLARMKN